MIGWEHQERFLIGHSNPWLRTHSNVIGASSNGLNLFTTNQSEVLELFPPRGAFPHGFVFCETDSQATTGPGPWRTVVLLFLFLVCRFCFCVFRVFCFLLSPFCLLLLNSLRLDSLLLIAFDFVSALLWTRSAFAVSNFWLSPTFCFVFCFLFFPCCLYLCLYTAFPCFAAFHVLLFCFFCFDVTHCFCL